MYFPQVFANYVKGYVASVFHMTDIADYLLLCNVMRGEGGKGGKGGKGGRWGVAVTPFLPVTILFRNQLLKNITTVT